MPLDLWLAFAAASFVVVVIPGPTILLVVSYALTQGRRVAVATALGVALGDFIAVSASLAGLGAVLLTSAWAFMALKWIGAAYLVFLGIKMLRTAPVFGKLEASARPPARHIFAHAALVTAFNPKGIIFIIAFVPQFLSPDHAVLPQFLTMLVTFVGLGAINALAYALLADQLRQRIRRPGILRWLNRLGGGVLVGMGIMTAAVQRS